MRKFLIPTLLLLALLLLMQGCAPAANVHSNTPNGEGYVAGFWMGLWHGMIALWSFIASLFWPQIGVYEIHNSGALYNLGFILGLGTPGIGLISRTNRD